MTLANELLLQKIQFISYFKFEFHLEILHIILNQYFFLIAFQAY